MPRHKPKVDLSGVVEFIQARLDEVGFDELTESQRLVLCVEDLHTWWFDLVTYFTRADADLVAEIGDKADLSDDECRRLSEHEAYWSRWHKCAENGLRTIGAPRAADAFARALDGEWIEAEEELREAEDVEESLREFVRQHPEDFGVAVDE